MAGPDTGFFLSVTALGCKKVGAQKIKKKTIFFHNKFYSLKAHAHYFTVLIYLATWRAAKLGIFTHFTFINLSQCSQSINSLTYVSSMQIPSCFLWVLDCRCYCTSSYYRSPPPKKSILPYEWIHSNLAYFKTRNTRTQN